MLGNGPGNFSTVSDVLAWLEGAPSGTLLAAESVAELLRRVSVQVPPEEPPAPPSEPFTWRAELWRVPSDTRLGVREVCAAVGRSHDWLYRHTTMCCAARIRSTCWTYAVRSA